MSIVVYNIKHPTADDPQVTGVGLYRTVKDGVTPLLIRRLKFPDLPKYSVTVPSDVTTIGESLGSTVFTAELFAQMGLVVPAGTIQFFYKFKRNRISYTNGADRDFIQNDGRIFELCHMICYPATQTGIYVLYSWEVDQIQLL